MINFNLTINRKFKNKNVKSNFHFFLLCYKIIMLIKRSLDNSGPLLRLKVNDET